jgi:hypothetical protein
LPAEPFGRAEWLLIGACVLTGFMFFEFKVMSPAMAGLGTTLFFWLPLAVTLAYLRHRRVQLDAASWLLFGLAAASALPFVLFGTSQSHGLSLALGGGLSMLWLAYSCRTLMARPLTWILALDWVNQFLLVPYANIGLFWRRLTATDANHQRVRLYLAVMASLIVSLPLLMYVLYLLAASDHGFFNFLYVVIDKLDIDSFTRWGMNLTLGLPLATLLITSVLGNISASHTHHLSKAGLQRAFADMHVVPQAAVLAPLGLFILTYLAYAAVMGGYLLEAFGFSLPAGYTYAGYARQGAFELFTVAGINAAILSAVWALAKRESHAYPPWLRCATALFSLLTLLLVATAASKMLLYVQAYGLTFLRFGVTWLIASMGLCYALVLAWSVRPFNVARPIITIAITTGLTLTMVNPPLLIANHNVDRHLSGQSRQMDTDTLVQYGPSAVPAMRRLADQAPDAIGRMEARRTIARIQANHIQGKPWHSWNLLSAMLGLYG